MMKREIQPLFLVGDKELGAAIGISTSESLRTLRDEGLPYYHNGKSFVYDPEEVKTFLKHLWQVKKVKLKTRQENGKR